MSTPQHQEFKHSNVTVYSWHKYGLFFIYFTLLKIRECYFYVSSWYVILRVAVTGKKRLFQASSYCFQRALTDHSQTAKSNSLSNFASFRSKSSGLQNMEVPISDGVDTTAVSLELHSTAPSQEGPRTAMGSLFSSVPTSGHCTALSRRRYCVRKPETLALQT